MPVLGYPAFALLTLLALPLHAQTFTTQFVDIGTTVVEFCSLAMVGGNPAISYDTTNTSLMWATLTFDADSDGLLDSWELTYWPTTGHNALDEFDHDGYCELLRHPRHARGAQKS
jgi:hypothetical protein